MIIVILLSLLSHDLALSIRTDPQPFFGSSKVGTYAVVAGLRLGLYDRTLHEYLTVPLDR